MSRKRTSAEPQAARIDSLTHEGRGVARVQGKAVFIDGALPGEEVLFRLARRHGRFDEGVVTEVLVASPERVPPGCPHFSLCGGCSLQYLAVEGQLAHKQRVMLEQLEHIGKVQPETVLPPVTGSPWGYRRRARLGVKYVSKKGAVLVGFREKASGLLADLSRCDTLHPAMGLLLPDLRALVGSLSVSRAIPQIEVAVGDDAAALVFRHLEPLSAEDVQILRQFAQARSLQIYLQPQGPESVAPLWPQPARLSYRLADHGVELFFQPTDFVQVNAEVNRKMVHLALQLLELSPEDRVLDLFCGLGNFTLPMARQAACVVGVEGDAKQVLQARENAAHNDIVNVEFHVADLLNAEPPDAAWLRAGFSPEFSKILLDPPRTGAEPVVRQAKRIGAERLVYVSCNPATLARDAGELVHGQGYHLAAAGVIDMFPHTGHVETVALFTTTNP
jgi:23S rRNA (uracil1939-C5)-methyltransferase